jgi:hypothetical protein
MSVRTAAALAALLSLGLLAGPVLAKRFRFASGPAVPADTALSVAVVEVQPIVRARGPRVPATNLQLVSLVANTAFERALAVAPIDSGSRLTLAPQNPHALNYLVEYAVLRNLSKRGITAVVRRTPMPEDSTLTQALGGDDPLLEYRLATARVTYLRLVGWLPGRVRIERQAQIEGNLVLRDPQTLRVLWVGDAAYNLLDSFPKDQLALVDAGATAELKSTIPDRNVDKLVEPVLVLAIVGGLVALFFQNRP